MKSKIKTASFGFFAIVLAAVLAVTAVLHLPENLWKGGDDSSSMTVQQLSQKEVCFETPHVDANLSNDEQFGAQKSPTSTNVFTAAIGTTSHFDLPLLNANSDAKQDADQNTQENGDQTASKTSELFLRKSDTSISTAYSSGVKPTVFDVGFTNEIENGDTIVGAKFSETPDGDLQGLAVSNCVGPQTDFWFIGAGTTLKDTATLFLANPSLSTSEVTVSVWGSSENNDLAEDGTFKYVGNRTFGVSAQTQTEVILTAGVSGQDVIAVNVKAAYSPIAATILSRTLNGLSPFGIDYSNPLPSPSKNLSIPGIKVSKDEKVSAVLNLFAPEIKEETELNARFTCVQEKSVVQSDALKKATSEDAEIAPENAQSGPSPSSSATPAPSSSSGTSAKPSASPSPSSSVTAKPSSSPSPSSSATKQTAAEKAAAEKAEKEKAEKEAVAQAGIVPTCKSEAIDKTFKVSPSRVLSTPLDFLTDGIWNVEIIANSKFIANSKVTSIVKDNGKESDNEDAKEFALISPATESENILLPLSSRVDSSIALSTSSDKADVNYTIYSKTGHPIAYGLISLGKDKPVVIPRAALMLPDLVGNYVQLKTGGCKGQGGGDNKDANCETNKIGANAVFLNPKSLSSLSPLTSELNNQTYTFSTREIR